MNIKVLKILAALITITVALGLFNINSFSTVAADENLENSAVQFLSSFYEARNEAIVNNDNIDLFLSSYALESTVLKKHEIERTNFYRKFFNGIIKNTYSKIKFITDSFQISGDKASIQIYDKYNVLEAGTAPPPSVSNASELKDVIDKDLGIQTKGENIGKPQFVYLGYDFYLAVYEMRGQSIAFDLRARRVALISDLRDHLLSPEQYEAQKGGVQPLGWTEWFSLPVPIRDQNDPVLPPDKRNNNNCGPTSGAMIDEYYKIYRGYSRFDNWPADHNRLYETMHTNGGLIPGTMPWNAGPGFVSYAAEKQYSFGTTYYGPSYDDYNLIKTYINAQQPIMILFWRGAPYASWHYCAIKGYDTYDSTKYLVINNPWGYSDSVNWDANWGWVTIHWLWPR